MQEDVTCGSVELTAACLLPRYLFDKAGCQRGSAVREETAQGKTFEYKYSIPTPPAGIFQTRFVVCFLQLKSLCQATDVAKQGEH